MDGSQGTGARALHLAALLWGGQDAANANNDNITTAEFLLKLADETLLDLVERFEQAERNLDQDSFARS